MIVQKEGRGQPVSLRERVHFLDIVRGFALLGIIIVNYFLIVDSVKGFEMASDDVLHNLVSWFAEGKFVTLFSFLFGVGFMIFMDRAAQKVDSPNKLFARRLSILLGFGILHITFVWVGDILTFYAVSGFLLLAFYKRTAKTVLRWIIALIVFQFLTPVFTMLYNVINTAGSKNPNFSEFTLFSHTTLTYMESISTRWTDMVTMAAGSFSMIYSMFLMFLLGVYFVKMEFFKDMEAKKFIWKRIWIISTIAFLITQSSILLDMFNLSENMLWKDISSVLGQNGGLTGSMFYMSTFAMLFLYVPQLRSPMMIFTKVGRMSLTCYLLHSIIGTVLFLRYGFGLADHIQSAGTFMFSLAVYFVLMSFSTLWLKRFKYGPMELIWRKLTYGKVNGSPKATPLHSEKSIQK
ncbi:MULTISPECIES: DUF418 domain-containing protein [Bacillus]|uniref:Uncharacterized protein n=1 Tax=Bacillus amyloliquefaciens (strain Y2) TaxID=1155777 RepID=I2C815_BACAY|nr:MULTISPECIES: DUF418 domain-containing protein [Bacillus]SLB12192.1 Predicted membrane protein [Mycobacteroides abscessus subsp. massiliense]AFJ62789.1 conserved hypothetical protein YrkO [Bacillus velezensis YAU B9601-Y2]AJE79421.1 hypothetical protein OY17_15325 [Bacillus sp. BH072]ASK59179.1 hypothetical protein CFN60_12580 [Bacillus velezensis]ATU27514.1 hypothetical protein BMJ37_12390 [Bacillus velezensis]